MAHEQQTDGGRPGGSAAAIDAVSVEVVERLAEANGCDADALPPLYRSVDPDALEHLVASSGGDGGLSQISFSHAGCEVSVTGDGEVTVTDSGH